MRNEDNGFAPAAFAAAPKSPCVISLCVHRQYPTHQDASPPPLPIQKKSFRTDGHVRFRLRRSGQAGVSAKLEVARFFCQGRDPPPMKHALSAHIPFHDQELRRGPVHLRVHPPGGSCGSWLSLQMKTGPVFGACFHLKGNHVRPVGVLLRNEQSFPPEGPRVFFLAAALSIIASGRCFLLSSPFPAPKNRRPSRRPLSLSRFSPFHIGSSSLISV